MRVPSTFSVMVAGDSSLESLSDDDTVVQGGGHIADKEGGMDGGRRVCGRIKPGEATMSTR